MFLALFLSIVTITAGPVQFSGTVGISAEQDWIQTIGNDTLRRPNSELRFTWNPTFTIYGMPISMDILMSSYESKLRQAIDKFKIYLNPKELLKQTLNAPPKLSFIKGIELGTCNPFYSPLTVSGATVTGGSVEFYPWYFYLASAVGRSQRAVEGSDTTQPAYSRMFYSARFGFGKKEKTHVFFTGLKIRDDPNSITRNYIVRPGDTLFPPDTVEIVTPKENYLLGIEFNLASIKNLFRIESEIVGSMLTRDNRAQALHIDQVPVWLDSLVHPRWTSGVDFAYSVKSSFKLDPLKFYGSVKMVGPGYQTLGNPTLRKDNFSYGGGIDGAFLNNSISFSGSYSHEQDNLLNMKRYTTSFISYSTNLGINFPNVPYFQLNYNPYTQQNDNLYEHADIASINTGYSFNTGKVSNSPNLSVSFQKRKTSSPSDDYTMFDINLSHSLGFEFPLSVSISGDLNQSTRPSETNRIVSFTVSPSYTAFGTWNNSLVLSGSFESGTKRFDTRLNSSFPIWKIADANISVERNFYRGSDGSYNEFRLVSSLSRSW